MWRGTLGRDLVRRHIHGRTKRPMYAEGLNRIIFVSDEFGKWMRKVGCKGSWPIPIIEKSVDWLLEQKEAGKVI